MDANNQDPRFALHEVRLGLIQWAEHGKMLQNHIQNGVARGLYPQRVADLAFRYLEQVAEIETDNLLDCAKAAAKEQ